MARRWEVFDPHYGPPTRVFRSRSWARFVARLAGLDYDRAGTFVAPELTGGAGDGD